MVSSPTVVLTSNAPQNLTLPLGALAAVSLPPFLFRTITDRSINDTIGVFFTFYEDSTLFPVRPIEITDNSTLRPAVASGIVGATVGPGLEFVDLRPSARVQIILRTISNFPESVRKV